MSSIPSTIRAVVVQADKSVKVASFPAPKLVSPDDVIVKVYSCAQNPTDAKGISLGRTAPGRITGTDFAGVVVAIGDNVKNVKIGNRIASVSFGSFLEDGTGAFSEYTRIPSGRALHVPDSMSMNEATTLGVAILTAAVGLYQELQLPIPPAPSSDIPILIWSGATSVGMLAIQVATLSGLQVITTASPQNHDLLKSFGAQHVLDYRSPTVVEDIFRLTGGRLEYIYDCISEQGSTQTAVKCLRGAGGKVVTLLPVDASTLDKAVELHTLALFKITGKGFSFGGRSFAGNLQDKEWAEDMCSKLSTLILDGKLKGNPVRLMGGLDAVPEGFKYMGDGKVRAEKLVYEVVKE